MKKSLIGPASLVVIASLILATPTGQTQPRPRIDVNGDGVIDFSELQAVRPKLTVEEFNAMDKNSDGQLDHDEMLSQHREMRMRMVDTDGDGQISREEMGEFHERRGPDHLFEKFDADSDGKLSKQELAAMHEEMAKHGPKMRKCKDAPCGMPEGGPEPVDE